MKLAFTLLSLLGFLFLFNCLAAANFIADTCKQCSNSSPNINYNLCVSSLSSAPGSKGADLKGLGVIAVELATASTNRAKSKAKSLLKANPGNPDLVSGLKTCISIYSDAVSDLNDSAGAIQSGHYNDANVQISSALDAPDTCESNLKEKKIASPLATENKEMFNLSVIALAIDALLQKQ